MDKEIRSKFLQTVDESIAALSDNPAVSGEDVLKRILEHHADVWRDSSSDLAFERALFLIAPRLRKPEPDKEDPLATQQIELPGMEKHLVDSSFVLQKQRFKTGGAPFQQFSKYVDWREKRLDGIERRSKAEVKEVKHLRRVRDAARPYAKKDPEVVSVEEALKERERVITARRRTKERKARGARR